MFRELEELGTEPNVVAVDDATDGKFEVPVFRDRDELRLEADVTGFSEGNEKGLGGRVFTEDGQSCWRFATAPLKHIIADLIS